MKTTKTYAGTGSIQSGEDWHDCEYHLHLVQSRSREFIEGAVKTNEIATVRILMTLGGTTKLRLSTGQEVTAHIQTYPGTGPIRVAINGLIDKPTS